MAKTYTFPAITLPSGTVQVLLITSRGSGSSVETEKYFTRIGTFTDETDWEGGILRQASIQFGIEHDLNDLFRDTILPSLDDNGGYVDVIFKHNSTIKYFGTINKKSVQYGEWYSVNSDDGSSANNSVSFVTDFVLSKMKYISAYDWLATLAPYTYPSPGDATESSASIFSLISSMLSFLGTEYSYEITLIFKPRLFICTDGYFFYQDALGNITYSTSESRNAVGQQPRVTYKHSGGTISNLFSNALPEVDGSFMNQQNLFDVFSAILQSFGLIVKIDYLSETKFVVSVITRDDLNAGNLISPISLINSEKMLVGEEFIDTIQIFAEAYTDSYKTSLVSVPQNSYSYTGKFVLTDSVTIGNELCVLTRLPNGASDPAGSTLLYAANIYDEIDLLDNSYSWDYSSGVSDNSSVYNSPYSLQSIEFDINGVGGGSATLTAQRQLTTGITENLVFIAWVKFITDSSPNDPTLRVDFLDADQNVIKTATQNIANADLPSDWRLYVFYFDNLKSYANNSAQLAQYIKITMSRASAASGTLKGYVTFQQVHTCERTMQKWLGRKIFNYFSKVHGKYIRKYDGIQYMSIGDRIQVPQGGSNYFIKKTEFDYHKNETGIEAINYR